MQVKLTARNERWLRREARKWSATPTLLANQMLAEGIVNRGQKIWGKTVKQWEQQARIDMGKPQ
jgi:hypothetical protein